MEFVELEKYSVKISSCGCVISTITGKKLNAIPDQYGYPRVYAPTKSGGRKGLFLHRLLALAFISNPDSKPHINHKDGNKGNYSIENLEWVTHKENIMHALKTGLLIPVGRPRNKERDEKIRKLFSEGYSIETLADYYSVTKGRIRQVISFTDTNKGYKPRKHIAK